MAADLPTEEEIRAAYEAKRSRMQEAADRLEHLLPLLLNDADINFHHVSARAKDVDSFCAKAMKYEEDGKRKYGDPLKDIDDQVAARVITFLPATVEDVCTVLAKAFIVSDTDDKGEKLKREGRFGYASKHLLLRLKEDRANHAEYGCLRGVEFEMQVRTVVQHAWAEFEHDVRYKYEIPPDKKPTFDLSFARAAALLEMADREFAELNDLYQELARETAESGQPQASIAARAQAPTVEEQAGLASPRKTQAPISAESLPALLAKRYPEATRSRRNHYTTMVTVLANLDIHSAEGLERALNHVDSEAVARAMDHKLPAGHVRRLEDDLLLAYDKRYLGASDVDGLSGRRAILMSRLKKLRDLR